jgi:hypothetical protein
MSFAETNHPSVRCARALLLEIDRKTTEHGLGREASYADIGIYESQMEELAQDVLTLYEKLVVGA